MGQEINRTRFSEADLEQFSARLAEETAALRSFAKAGGFRDARYAAGLTASRTTTGYGRAAKKRIRLSKR